MKAISILPAITITDGKEKLFIKFGDNICKRQITRLVKKFSLVHT